MQEFLVGLFGELWSTLVMSFIPMIELKGGIIYARSVGYDFLTAFGLAYLGSTTAFVFMFFLFRPVMELLKRIKFVKKFAMNVEEYFQRRAQRALDGQNRRGKKRRISERLLKMLAVGIFVGIPLPMTGVWTGTVIAVLVGLNFWDAFVSIALGNLVAGTLISLLAEFCIRVWSLDSLNIALWVLFGLVLVLSVIAVLGILFKKKPDNKKDEEKVGEDNK